MPPFQRSTHSPQLKITLIKFIELLMLGWAPATAGLGLMGRKACWDVTEGGSKGVVAVCIWQRTTVLEF